MHCADCGTRYRGGLCPNCHEEAYILRHQTDDYDGGFGEDFLAKAERQERAAIAAKRNDK